MANEVQGLSEKVSRIERAVKFKPSASLTPELKQNLGRVFGKYYAYLKDVGFPLSKDAPTAFVDPSQREQAYYQPPPVNEIVLSPDFAQVEDAGLREYTFYALNVVKPGLFEIASGLQSGLADYFPCSFSGRSEFSKEIFEELAKRYPGSRLPPRDLDNHRSFAEIHPGQTEYHEEGNVWGGAFRQVRKSIGQAATDRLLFAAWKNFQASGSLDLMMFPRELLKQDAALYGGVHTQQIQSVFEQRGLKF